METALEIMEDALSLPRSDRSYLAAKLIESLDDDKDLSPEVLDEFERRSKAVQSGEVEAVSLEDARVQVKQILNQ